MEQAQQVHGSHGRFVGSWARLNCEDIPVIPAWIVRCNLKDPRKIPYLLAWMEQRNGKIREGVRLSCTVAAHTPHDEVELKRTDGSITVLRIVWRTLPRNGGRALLLSCSTCSRPCLHVYGWEWDCYSGWSNVVRQVSWRCRSCARLRYSSEGGHLRPRSRFLRCFGNRPRPELWLPLVFISPREAAEAGICSLPDSVKGA